METTGIRLLINCVSLSDPYRLECCQCSCAKCCCLACYWVVARADAAAAAETLQNSPSYESSTAR